MKIIFSIKSLNIKGGGSERVLVALINELLINNNIQNYEIVLVTQDITNNFFYSVHEKCIIKLMGRKKSFFSAFYSFFISVKFILEYNPNFVVAFNISSYIPLSIVSLFNPKIKLIGSEHSTYQALGNSIVKRTLFYLSSFFIYKYTFLSERVILTFPSFINNKAIVIQNPICLPDNANLNLTIYDSSFFNIITVGRLVAEKNQYELLLAMREIKKMKKLVRLYIYGDGILKDFLFRKIYEFNLEDVVFIKNSVSDINSIYVGADVFCLPSLYEGFGMSAAEAIAYKIPVIGYDDCIGLKDLVIHNINGFLLQREMNSQRPLVSCISYIITHPEKFDRIKSNCSLPFKYHMKHVSSKWRSLLNI
jgi:glycosyltransferase involved in cell wall biosynthesis